MSLFRRLDRCRPSSTKAAAAATAAGDSSPPVRAATGLRSAGTDSTRAARSVDGTSSPVWATAPSSKAAITSRVCSGATRALNTVSTAPLTRLSKIAPSRPSSSDSISILPPELAASASRSSIRGTTTRSPERSPRRSALAPTISWLVTDSRTLTPLRWLTWVLALASWLIVLITSAR